MDISLEVIESNDTVDVVHAQGKVLEFSSLSTLRLNHRPNGTAQDLVVSHVK